MTTARPAVLAAAALAMAALPLAAAPLAAQSPAGEVEAAATLPTSEGERKLAKLLEGRVAGTPVGCIRALPTQRMRTIEGTAYVYGSGNTIWVQRTRDPGNIDNRDALVIQRFSGSQLCRQDLMTTVDRFNGFFTGVVFFEDFVPYSRMPSAARAEG